MSSLAGNIISHPFMLHHYPTPDAEGIDKTKELYLNRFGKTLTDEEAYEVLNTVMRLLYLLNPAYPGYDPTSYPFDEPPAKQNEVSPLTTPPC